MYVKTFCTVTVRKELTVSLLTLTDVCVGYVVTRTHAHVLLFQMTNRKR